MTFTTGSFLHYMALLLLLSVKRRQKEALVTYVHKVAVLHWHTIASSCWLDRPTDGYIVSLLHPSEQQDGKHFREDSLLFDGCLRMFTSRPHISPKSSILLSSLFHSSPSSPLDNGSFPAAFCLCELKSGLCVGWWNDASAAVIHVDGPTACGVNSH